VAYNIEGIFLECARDSQFKQSAARSSFGGPLAPFGHDRRQFSVIVVLVVLADNGHDYVLPHDGCFVDLLVILVD
jgi:hypothetical protein